MARERPLEESLGALTGPQTTSNYREELDPQKEDERVDLGALFVTRQREEEKQALLERMIFVRRSIEDYLQDTRIDLVEQDGRAVFRINKPVPADLVPWFVGVGDVGNVALWGKAGKMGCPTFDLPAGGLYIGGTCPGANDAQGVIPERMRKTHYRFGAPQADGSAGPKEAIRLDQTICSYCYAFEGNYPTLLPQTGEVVRYWWAKGAVARGDFADAVVNALLLENTWPREDQLRKQGGGTFKYRGQTLMPVRVHSAGDFFSIDYAEQWVEAANVLNRMKETRGVRLWAPTRTWESWGIVQWKKILDKLDTNDEAEGPNLLVRASAYHVDDFAPGWLHPKNAMGSTSIWRDHNRRRSWVGGRTLKLDVEHRKSDERFDYDCPIYTGEESTCSSAKCRACWVKPELRVNYETH